MNIKSISTVLLLFAFITTSGLAAVVINEVELDPYGDDTPQWIELYNTGDAEVDIGSWSIVPLSNKSAELFIDLVSIPARGFYVLTLESNWMNPSEETLILRDENGLVVDRTPLLYDSSNSECAWGRYPDGSNTWQILISSEGGPSSGELCAEEVSKKIKFDMDHRIYGSGYVKIRNVMHNRDTEYLKTHEFGSGSYESEESSQYSANLPSDLGCRDGEFVNASDSSGGAYEMTLTKSNLSARYSRTSFNVSPRLSVDYDTKWSESSSAYGLDSKDQESPSFHEQHSSANRLDSDVSIYDKNFDLEASLASDFEGIASVKSNLDNFRASEEYRGSFKVFNNYHENVSNKIKLSVEGEGFVSTDKRVGDKAYSYEKGTGSFRSEELIQSSDISSLNISRIYPPVKGSVFLAKSVSLHHSPANYSQAGIAQRTMSIPWREGTGSHFTNQAFMTSDFSDINELESETAIISSGESRASAKFSGRARLKAGYINVSGLSPTAHTYDPNHNFVFMDDEYAGNFSISRGYRVYPRFSVPHMSITSQGFVDPQDCSKLRYIITLTNDGNRPLGPIFVRTSFPSGTSFLDASLNPFELTPRYANWSVSYLSVGESFNINLDLEITKRKDSYASSSRAITIYQVMRGSTSSDRRLSASNSSLFDANWSLCSQQNLSATYSATSDSKNPKIINYRLMVENLGDENLRANITVRLPDAMRFINSTSSYEKLAEDAFFWTIDKLNAGKKRSISFMAKAEDNGFYLSNASVTAISLDDGREIASSQVIAPVMVGKTVYSITPTAWQDWCPCDENLLGKLSWNETSTKSGEDLGCVCD